MTASILVLDDDEQFRRSLTFLLKRAGYQVTTVDHPKAAFEALTTSYFDLLILDLKLPDMDGLSFLAEIRKGNPELPVVVLTGFGELESAVEAIRLNASDYILKPFEPAFFIDRIQKVLAQAEKSNQRKSLISRVKSLLAELEELEAPAKISEPAKVSTIPGDTSRYIQRDDFLLDLKAQQVEFKGRSITLPPSTFNYLLTLLRHAPRPVSFEALVIEAQGYAINSQEARSITRWQIFQLRQAIEPDPNHPSYILTVRNTGYRLVTSGGKKNYPDHDLSTDE